MTMYTQIGTSWPLRARVIVKPSISPDIASWQIRYVTITRP